MQLKVAPEGILSTSSSPAGHLGKLAGNAHAVACGNPAVQLIAASASRPCSVTAGHVRPACAIRSRRALQHTNAPLCMNTVVSIGQRKLVCTLIPPSLAAFYRASHTPPPRPPPPPCSVLMLRSPSDRVVRSHIGMQSSLRGCAAPILHGRGSGRRAFIVARPCRAHR